MPRAREVAVLIVGSFRFEDWETVWVQHRIGEAFALFRFTCAEREPLPDHWQALRFKPGDPCFITLGGQLAINGYIVNRQIAYDARNHGVQLDGKSNTFWAAKSSIDHQTHNFDDMNFVQVARTVLSMHPVGIKVIGAPDPTPYVRLAANPGETVWDFLERIARSRGIVLGSDEKGNFLIIGPHGQPVEDQLIEGQNILKCQCLITNDPMFQKYSVTGQTAGSDDKMGTEASEQFASVGGGTAPVYSHLITPAEQPVWGIGEVMARAEHEKLWHEGWYIEAHITVQGWLRSDGTLWRPGDVYNVNSPMALLNYPLAVEEVTFTQDRASGTQTTLKMVRPELLRIDAKYLVGPGISDTPAVPAPNGPVVMPPFPTINQFNLPPGTELKDGEIVSKK